MTLSSNLVTTLGLAIMLLALGTRPVGADCSDRTYECIVKNNVVINKSSGTTTTVST